MCHYYTGSGFYTENNRRVAGHMEVARTAAAAGVKTCVLTHITESIDIPGIRERIVSNMGTVFPGSIIFGEDLMVLSLKPPSVQPLV
jgi:ribonuclease BN (tRNA processing enzyme)